MIASPHPQFLWPLEVSPGALLPLGFPLIGTEPPEGHLTRRDPLNSDTSPRGTAGAVNAIPVLEIQKLRPRELREPT